MTTTQQRAHVDGLAIAENSDVVGREREQALLRRLLDEGHRLITVTGAPGVGKTRLVAAALRNLRYGAVDLQDTTEPDHMRSLILQAVNDRLALRDPAGQEFAIVVIESADRPEAGPVVSELCGRFPDVRFIATSRILLNLSNERLLRINELAPPPPDAADPVELEGNDAVVCFLHHARRVDPEFAFDATTVRDVVRLVQLTGGLPLAIALVCGWLRVMPLSLLTERAQQAFDVFRGGPSDLEPQHRDLCATIESSLDDLDEDAGSTLCALAAIGAPATENVIGHVLGRRPTWNTLSTLLDSNLARYESDPTGRQRLTMHPMIRRVVCDRADPTPYRDRLASWVEDVALPEARKLGGDDTATAHETIAMDSEALLAGLGELARQPERLGRAVVGLDAYWRTSRRDHDAEHWAVIAIRSIADEPLRQEVACVLAGTLRRQGRLGDAARLIEPIWERSRTDTARARAGMELLAVAYQRGERGPQLATTWRESLAAAQRSHDAVTEVWLVGTQHELCSTTHRSDAARADSMAACQLARSFGLHEQEVSAGYSVAHLDIQRGQLEEARIVVERCVQLGRRLGRTATLAFALAQHAKVLAHDVTEHERAVASALEAIEVIEALGRTYETAQIHKHVAMAFADCNEHARARASIGLALARFAALGDELQTADCVMVSVLIQPKGGEPSDRVRDLWAVHATAPQLFEKVPPSWRNRLDAAGWTDGDRPDSVPSLSHVTANVLRSLQEEPAVPDVAGRVGLTPRQFDVLELLARGLSDRQIARELYIGLRTVHSHVTAVLARLGVSRRSEAAAWYHDHIG